MKTLLLYPPFGMPDKPYISIACLMAYLRSRGYDVDVADINLEFFRKFLSGHNLSEAKAKAENRLGVLNRQPALNRSEMIEYMKLARLLIQTNRLGKGCLDPLSGTQIAGSDRLANFEWSVKLASVPHYPQGLDFTENTNYIRHKTPHKKFSTQSIFESLDTTAFFLPYVEEIIYTIIQRSDYDLIGISVTFPDQIIAAMHCAKILKRQMPNAHITLGGSYVSYHLRHIKEPRWFKFVDSMVIDEGEIPLERLIEALKNDAHELICVPGLIFLSRNTQEIVRTEKADPIAANLLPSPDYTLFPLERYILNGEAKALLFRLSRGCYWGKCSFCSTHIPTVAHYEQIPGDILYEQLKKIISQTGVRSFHITDDAACPEILECFSKKIIENNLKVTWATNVRFDKRLTIDRLMLYRRAGCRGLCLGLESYNNRILKMMRKGITTALVDRVLSNISWTGLNTEVYMIVGFPTETVEDARNSFEKINNFLKEGLISSCVYNVFQVAPYSRIAEKPEDFGITELNYSPSSDLLPPVARFEAPGMSREQAFELCTEFIMVLNGTNQKIGELQTEPVFEINLGKGKLRLNYRLYEIVSALMDGRQRIAGINSADGQ